MTPVGGSYKIIHKTCGILGGRGDEASPLMAGVLALPLQVEGNQTVYREF